MPEHHSADRTTNSGKGVHVLMRWSDVTDEAARNTVVQAAVDAGGVIRQTAGTNPGYYLALCTTGQWRRLDMHAELRAMSTGEDTTNGTTPITKVEIDIPDETGVWIVEGSALISHSNQNGNPSVWLENATTPAVLGRKMVCEMQDSANIMPVPFRREVSNTSGNGAQNIELRYAVDSGSGTMTISDAYITARKVTG